MNDTNKVLILAVNTGSAAEVNTETFEVSTSDPVVVKTTILDALNKMSKTSHCISKFKGKLYKFDHTASRGPSTDYLRTEIKYHPLAAKLA